MPAKAGTQYTLLQGFTTIELFRHGLHYWVGRLRAMMMGVAPKSICHHAREMRAPTNEQGTLWPFRHSRSRNGT
jgi:hypothetical protein